MGLRANGQWYQYEVPLACARVVAAAPAATPAPPPSSAANERQELDALRAENEALRAENEALRAKLARRDEKLAERREKLKSKKLALIEVTNKLKKFEALVEELKTQYAQLELELKLQRGSAREMGDGGGGAAGRAPLARVNSGVDEVSEEKGALGIELDKMINEKEESLAKKENKKLNIFSPISGLWNK